MVTAVIILAIVFIIVLAGFLSMRRNYNLTKNNKEEYILTERTIIFYNYVVSEKSVKTFKDKGEAMDVFMDLIK